MDHLSELPDELIYRIIVDLPYAEREYIRRSSRRFYNLFSRECIEYDVNFLRKMLFGLGAVTNRYLPRRHPLHPDQDGRAWGVLCAHKFGGRIIGTVAMFYYDQEGSGFLPSERYSLEGKIVTRADPTGTIPIQQRLVPVGEWKANVWDDYYLIEYDQDGLKDGIEKHYLKRSDGTILLGQSKYEHGTKVSEINYRIDRDTILHFQNRNLHYKEVIYDNRKVIYEYSPTALPDGNELLFVDGYIQQSLFPSFIISPDNVEVLPGRRQGSESLIHVYRASLREEHELYPGETFSYAVEYVDNRPEFDPDDPENPNRGHEQILDFYGVDDGSIWYMRANSNDAIQTTHSEETFWEETIFNLIKEDLTTAEHPTTSGHVPIAGHPDLGINGNRNILWNRDDDSVGDGFPYEDDEENYMSEDASQ